MDEMYDDYAGVCMGCENPYAMCDCDGKDDEDHLEPCLECDTPTTDQWGGLCHDCDNQLDEDDEH